MRLNLPLPLLLALQLLSLTPSPAHAALVDLYADENCQVLIGNKNVWDNSCAVFSKHTPFKSYNITYPGGAHQKLHPFDYFFCLGWQKAHCPRAVVDGKCHNAAFVESGASYAMGSCMLCTVF